MFVQMKTFSGLQPQSVVGNVVSSHRCLPPWVQLRVCSLQDKNGITQKESTYLSS